MGTYTGTAGGDTITSALVSSGVDAVPPGSKPSAADDTIDGLGGKDTSGGGGGNDTISAAGSGSVMHGDAGNDSITYDTDADAVSTWAYGDAGNDSIGFSSFQQSGGSPAGTLSFYGGTGNDTISSSGTDSSDYSGLTVNSYGQVGDDRLEATKAFTFSMAYPWYPDGNDNLYGGPGNDSYWVYRSVGPQPGSSLHR